MLYVVFKTMHDDGNVILINADIYFFLFFHEFFINVGYFFVYTGSCNAQSLKKIIPVPLFQLLMII